MKGGWRHEGGRGESYNLFLKHRKVKMGEEREEGETERVRERNVHEIRENQPQATKRASL